MYINSFKSCSIKALITLGNQTEDKLCYEQLGMLIANKLNNENKPILYLITMFNKTGGILKVAYANLITYHMRDNDYLISDWVIDEIVKLVPLNYLAYYGARSENLVFRNKCVNEFWKRAIDIEDYSLLLEKKMLDMDIDQKRYILFKRKRKGYYR